MPPWDAMGRKVNDIAKALWEVATANLEAAQADGSVNASICYTGIGELALKMAQFALDNAVGEANSGTPSLPLPDSPVPQGPSGGPRLWGSPS